MPDVKKTNAEVEAEKATSLMSFPINFDDFRRSINQILGQIQTTLFRTYTVHNFDHARAMLESLDWIIPPSHTKSMSAGDWFMVTLSAYLHDVGLLVTNEEFAKRDKTYFRKFCEETLFTGAEGADYRAKINLLDGDEREKFLYQEFVRAHHGLRSRCWIEGRIDEKIGCCDQALREVGRLLQPLSDEIKTDLAILCESHNLDDIENTKKYKLNQPYGNSDAEIVNLQYVAVLLRTTDLLHITSDRAPPILFRIINPTDPISLAEWAKQSVVRRVNSRPGRNKDDFVDLSAPRDTIEVFAKFSNENGFFGLTSYLKYAERQLRLSNEAIEKSKKDVAKEYSFPWRHIDTSEVEANGFLTKTFGFELDQTKILDLLTGHTLYNDSTVALRELTQNAIDAVRLQSHIDKTDSNICGKVEIIWRSETNELVVKDNGTGMTQDIIQKHLLKVGSSRYQDIKFREAHPDFSPISRFGIGVLSAFMIADSVEIVTCTPSEEKARQISLRSVHGQYLIRLLDKRTDPSACRLAPHGTEVRLKLRASANKVDVSSAARRWIKYPRCNVTVKIDNGPPTVVGYTSPEAAIEAYLQNATNEQRLGIGKTKVVQQTIGGTTIAYGLKFDNFFRDWNFIVIPERDEVNSDDASPLGTSVEGIAVDFNTPGFSARSILASANATGPRAPKTNVARSSLEETSENDENIKNIYDVYYRHVADETARLHKEEGHSLSKAISELPFLINPIINRRSGRVLRRDLNDESLSKLPMYLVEEQDDRRALSLSQLVDKKVFWTTESQLVNSIENLVREAQQDLKAADLLRAAGYKTNSQIEGGASVSNLREGGPALDSLLKKFQIIELVGDRDGRRVDAKWSRIETEGMWVSDERLSTKLRRSGLRQSYAYLRQWRERNIRVRMRSSQLTMMPLGEPTVLGLNDYQFVVILGSIYLLPNSPITKFLRPLFHSSREEENFRAIIYLDALRALMTGRPISTPSAISYMERSLKELSAKMPETMITDLQDFLSSISECGEEFASFDPFAWGQREIDEPI